MSFQLHALPMSEFSHLFALTDQELHQHNACREIVKAHPGTPCRVSLADAQVGETVILVNYEHQSADTPYKSRHAVYVREGVETAKPEPGVVPHVLQTRLISMRLFDANDMMIDADVVDGIDLVNVLDSAFLNEQVDYIHLHYAKPGCFAAKVTRV